MSWQRTPVLGAVALGIVACAAPGGSPPAGGQQAAPAPPGTGAQPTASGPDPSAPPTPVTLRFGLNTVTANLASLWAAKDEGFFLRYGIDAELLPIPAAERIISALISGEVPITTLAPTAVIH